MVSPEMAMLSVFITPWMNPTAIHCAMSAAWRSATCLEERQRRIGRVTGLQLRVVPRNGVVQQGANAVGVAARGEILEGADAQVAGRDAREHGAGLGLFTQHLLPGGHHGQRAGGGNAQREHGFADEVFAQHGAHGRAAVAGAREGRAARALELHVVQLPVHRAQLAEQDGATIAQLRHEVRELVARIGHGDGLCIDGQFVAGEQRGQLLPVCSASAPAWPAA